MALSVQPSARGVGLTAAGAGLCALGVGIASPLVVTLGLGALLAALIGGAWTLALAATLRSGFPSARRKVAPFPLIALHTGTVTVKLEGRDGSWLARAVRRSLLSDLDLREQASAELTGGLGTKATLATAGDTLTLTYTVIPIRRGRWEAGPASARVADPLGMAQATVEMGASQRIPVWPSLVDLSGAAGALLGQTDRVATGSRSPSADDAALRDYRDGDDLRRVHWPSTARTGTMVVRADEHAGRRPATVLMGLPTASEPLEWTITAAASIAVAILETGHPVRLVGGGLPALRFGAGATVHRELERARLLDLTIDLTAPASTAESAIQVREAAAHARPAPDEVVIAVLDPLPESAWDTLGELASGGHAWALVRGTDNEAQATATALAHHGWRVRIVSTGDELSTAWAELAGGRA